MRQACTKKCTGREQVRGKISADIVAFCGSHTLLTIQANALGGGLVDEGPTYLSLPLASVAELAHAGRPWWPNQQACRGAGQGCPNSDLLGSLAGERFDMLSCRILHLAIRRGSTSSPTQTCIVNPGVGSAYFIQTVRYLGGLSQHVFRMCLSGRCCIRIMCPALLELRECVRALHAACTYHYMPL